MAVRFKLGRYETVENDPLGRSYVGYFPRMTEVEAWEAGRGLWRVSIDKVTRQKFALIVGEGIVRAVVEIETFHPHDDKMALKGTVLTEGHPVRDAYIGKPDPVDTGSHNPVGYCSLPEEQPFILRACGCGCGTLGERDFQPGHEVRAMQDRVREHFDGSPLKFINWVDNMLTTSKAFSRAQKNPGGDS